MSTRNDKAIKLIGDRREGGYVFFSSDELPGFSLMLNAEQASSEQKIKEYLVPAAISYMEAIFSYEADRMRKRSPRTTIRKISSDAESSYIAELCPA